MLSGCESILFLYSSRGCCVWVFRCCTLRTMYSLCMLYYYSCFRCLSLLYFVLFCFLYNFAGAVERENTIAMSWKSFACIWPHFHTERCVFSSLVFFDRLNNMERPSKCEVGARGFKIRQKWGEPIQTHKLKPNKHYFWIVLIFVAQFLSSWMFFFFFIKISSLILCFSLIYSKSDAVRVPLKLFEWNNNSKNTDAGGSKSTTYIVMISLIHECNKVDGGSFCSYMVCH